MTGRIQSPAIKAALWMIGCLTCFSLMAVAGRETSDEIGTAQLLFLRSVVGLVIVLMAARFFVGSLDVLKTGVPRLHAFRAVSHFAGQYGWFYGLAFMPLAQVFAIEFTAPLWIAIIAPFVLGERLSAFRFGTIVLGFLGVLVMLRPGVIEISTEVWIVTAAAVAFAATHTTTKFLTRTEPTIRILFYMTLLQIPIGLVFSLQSWVWPGPETLAWTVLVAIAALTAHMCLTNALSLADATIVTPLDFLRLPFIALVGYLAYNETIDIWFMTGAVIVFAANYLNIIKTRPATPAPE